MLLSFVLAAQALASAECFTSEANSVLDSDAVSRDSLSRKSHFGSSLRVGSY